MKTLFCVAFPALLLASCSGSDTTARHVVKEWMGKEVHLPQDMVFIVQGDTVDYDWEFSDYRIVAYVDSAGCTKCKMHLPMWQSVMERLNSTGGGDVSLLMIVETSDPDGIVDILQEDGFCLPVTVEGDMRFSRENALPHGDSFRTFLLDSDNKVVAIGNPVTNSGIYKLYQDLIRGEESGHRGVSTTMPVYSKVSHKNIGVVHPGETRELFFEISNDSGESAVVDTVMTSCDCSEAWMRQDTILPNSKGYLLVRHTADSVSGEFERTVSVSFKNQDIPLTYAIHGFVK